MAIIGIVLTHISCNFPPLFLLSRTVLEANSSGGKLSKPAEVIFGGDIILRFQHTPQSKDEAGGCDDACGGCGNV